MANLSDLGALFERLIASPGDHAPGGAHYQALAAEWIAAFRGSSLAGAAATPIPFGPFGPLALPYRRMGAIDSVDLFGLDELILFAFYWANRSRYRRSVDIGANIGLHSIVMARCGLAVRSFEPD